MNYKSLSNDELHQYTGGGMSSAIKKAGPLGVLYGVVDSAYQNRKEIAKSYNDAFEEHYNR